MPSTPPVNRKHFVVVAVVEGLAVVITVLRFVFSNGAIVLQRPVHLVWYMGTFLLAGSAVAHLVVRSSRLRRDARPDADDASRQIFALSVAIALGALALAVVGPAPFEALLSGSG